MAITIPANTVAFLTRVKSDLSSGSILGNMPFGTPAAPVNFLKAQDMANVLRLLQATLSSTTPLTTTANGTTTTSVDGASTFVANTQVGFTVTFLSGTALNIGQSRVITSNTTTTLTFSPPLPAATATSDTYSIRATVLDAKILAMMNGHDVSKGESPIDTYDEMRLAQDCLVLLNAAVGQTAVAKVIFSTTALAGTSTTVIKIDTRGTSLRIDEFRGLEVLYNGTARRRILGNTENLVTLDFGVTAPSGGEAFVIGRYADDNTPNRCAGVHSGGQSGDNYTLATFIDTVQTGITAFTVPT